MPRADRSRKYSWLCVGLMLVIGSSGAAAVAQDLESFPLREEMRQKLHGLQEAWIEWLTAVQEGDSKRAERNIDRLVSISSGIDMPRLPELAVAAAANADRFVRAGDFDKAKVSLDAAEALDPGLPEAAVGRVALARAEGDRFGALFWRLRVAARTLLRTQHRNVVFGDLGLWLLAMLTLLAGAFVAVQWATRGVLLFRDVVRFFSRSLPPIVAHVLAVLLLAWPILLPTGLLWLTLYWSVLVWAYGSRWERVALVAIWIFLGLLPLLVSEQVRRSRFESAPMVRALNHVVDGRLTGQAFHVLGGLTETLPNSAAAKHFLADLHLRLHQWELARNLYRQLLEKEPTNTSARADLGACYFYEGNLSDAVRSLKDATDQNGSMPEALYNLSRALSEEYRFNESEIALRRASALEPEAVSEWIRRDEENIVVMTSGGIGRVDEVRDELARTWREQAADPNLFGLWRRTMSLPLAFIFILPAIGLYFISRKGGNRSRRIDQSWFGEPFETVRRTLLPGFPEGEDGRWRRVAWLLSIPLGLLGLNFWDRLTYGAPLGLVGESTFMSYVPLALLLVFLAYRGYSMMTRTRSED